MKFREHTFRSVSCWAPKGVQAKLKKRGILAAGTLGGTIDLDFNTSATLEFFGMPHKLFLLLGFSYV
jgi:hypothetical protein